MPASPPFVHVALPVPLPRRFDYLPPLGHAAGEGDVGRRVRVPFGPRELCGVVVGIGAASEDAPELRHALALLDEASLFHGELPESLRWLARYTHAPQGEVFATALPAALRRGEPLPDTHAWAWRLTPEGAAGLARRRTGTRPRRLAELLDENIRDEDSLDDLLEDWRGAARALARRGFAVRIAVP